MKYDEPNIEWGWMVDRSFTFLDDQLSPYRVQRWPGTMDPNKNLEDVWLWYWHPDNQWVSLRKIASLVELNAFYHKRMSDDRARTYDPDFQGNTVPQDFPIPPMCCMGTPPTPPEPVFTLEQVVEMVKAWLDRWEASDVMWLAQRNVDHPTDGLAAHAPDCAVKKEG